MRNLTFPSAAKINGWRLYVQGHSRGSTTQEGAGTFARGSGAHFVGQLSLAPMAHSDALQVRAFLHRLRGRAGSFLMTMPGTEAKAVGTAAIAAASSKGASAATLSSVTNSAELVAGAYMVIGDLTATGQLVQIVTVSGSDVTFRPRLRTAQAGGITVTFGRVQGLFQLAELAPAVPIMPAVSPGLELAIHEYRV